MEKYTLERDGQFDFYNSVLPRVNPELKVEDLLADDNDGVLNGNLLEFKLHIKDLNAVLDGINCFMDGIKTTIGGIII